MDLDHFCNPLQVSTAYCIKRCLKCNKWEVEKYFEKKKETKEFYHRHHNKVSGDAIRIHIKITKNNTRELICLFVHVLRSKYDYIEYRNTFLRWFFFFILLSTFFFSISSILFSMCLFQGHGVGFNIGISFECRFQF